MVTARKVEESLMEVPGDHGLRFVGYRSGGHHQPARRAELTPGLSFFNAFGEFLPVPVIRGVAPTDIFGVNNAAIFVDGVSCPAAKA